MKRIGLRMQLLQGKKEEYKKRHDEIWPELTILLKSTGIHHYVIFFDEPSHVLYANFEVEDEKSLQILPEQPIMKKWWAYMADIMEVNTDNSPISIPMEEVFFMA